MCLNTDQFKQICASSNYEYLHVWFSSWPGLLNLNITSPRHSSYDVFRYDLKIMDVSMSLVISSAVGSRCVRTVHSVALLTLSVTSILYIFITSFYAMGIRGCLPGGKAAGTRG
jgi:hypothetical protein